MERLMRARRLVAACPGWIAAVFVLPSRDSVGLRPTRTERGMKRRMSILAALVAVGMLGTGTADARRLVPTTITHDSSVALGSNVFLDTGHVTSRSDYCRTLREVRLVGMTSDGSRTDLDVDLSSYFGAWATLADYSGFARVKAKATRLKFRTRRGQRRVCKSAVVIWPVPRQ
jgi:hypothetical protein